jgi:phage gp29-like protein
VEAGGDGSGEKAAAEAFGEELKGLDVPRIIEEMMDAVAYGYSPLEVLWEARDGKWGIGDIVGKPPEWFGFTPENRMVLGFGPDAGKELPGNRFLIVRHGASYVNPYGSKLFSKCFWPLTFKRKGWQWWAVFVEKYGGAFMYGKYPNNVDDRYRADLFESLQRMISDAVAIVPEGSEVTIESLANKGSVSNIHREFIDAANAEVSKAVLGQTLTTEIGDKGSYAAAQAHNLVREDLAGNDRRSIGAAFNRLSRVYTFYNFGPEVIPPRFEFVKDAELHRDRAERDAVLVKTGWKLSRAHVSREYGIPEEELEPVAQSPAASGFGIRGDLPAFPSPCCHGNSNAVSLFASREEKAAARDRRLMEEFAETMYAAGQKEIDGAVESYADALGKVNSYGDAARAIAEAYKKRGAGPLARVIQEVRYAAAGIGGARRGRDRGS